MGVVVGLTVNAAIFPPLHLSGAVEGLASLRLTLARQLKERHRHFRILAAGA